MKKLITRVTQKAVLSMSDLFKTTLGWILQNENNTAVYNTAVCNSLWCTYKLIYT